MPSGSMAPPAVTSIFWSATGYGEDEEKKPWSHEHFGMTTAEAMVGGCVR